MRSECTDCEDHFCCIYLGQRTCPKHCRRQNCFCAHCQLYHIEIISPAVYCQHCDSLSNCYNYKHVGRIANRNSHVLGKYCVEHCPTPDCPHREETTVGVTTLLAVPITPSYPSKLYHNLTQHNVDPTQKVDVTGVLSHVSIKHFL